MSDETGKCKKAMQSLRAVWQQASDVTERLVQAKKILHTTCSNDKEITDVTEVQNPDRILFEYHGLRFYMDFCLLSDENDIEGAIVYGVMREPRYPYSLWIAPITDNKQSKKEPDTGSSKEKSKREDKPLAHFAVNDLGKISIKGKLDDEWWLYDPKVDCDKDKDPLGDRKKAVQEMHYRALDLIWRDALNWVNEPLLP